MKTMAQREEDRQNMKKVQEEMKEVTGDGGRKKIEEESQEKKRWIKSRLCLTTPGIKIKRDLLLRKNRYHGNSGDEAKLKMRSRYQGKYQQKLTEMKNLEG